MLLLLLSHLLDCLIEFKLLLGEALAFVHELCDLLVLLLELSLQLCHCLTAGTDVL